jgi:uncharacterized metal-binding protein YceD (DUF177 family)
MVKVMEKVFGNSLPSAAAGTAAAVPAKKRKSKACREGRHVVEVKEWDDDILSVELSSSTDESYLMTTVATATVVMRCSRCGEEITFSAQAEEEVSIG